MKARVALWPLGLIGRCNDGRPRVSCGTACAVAVLTSMLTGCTGTRPVPPPVVVGAVLCPEPTAPVLPLVDGGNTFDAPAAWAVLMERDDAMRAYIKGLRRTADCYKAQVTEPFH